MAKALRAADVVELNALDHELKADTATVLADILMAWELEDLVERRKQRLSLTESGRRQREQVLLWLASDLELEEKLAEATGLPREPEALWGLVAPLRKGMPLARGVVLEDAGHGFFVLEVAGEPVKVHLYAPLEAGGRRRLKVASSPPEHAWNGGW